jgi:HAD superfamily hydrolase (TIGR01484 family)
MTAIRPKLAVFDLDGTLAESKQPLSPDMGDLLARLLGRMPVAVMSGAGMPQFERQFLSRLPDEAPLQNLYLFPDNAAQCFVHKAGSWHPQYDYAFTKEEREHILAGLAEALKDTGLSQVPVRVWGERVEDRGAEIVFSGLGQEAPLEEKQKWDPSGEKRNALREALARRLPEFSEATGGSTSVDITRKGIDKAYGVARLSEMAGIPVSEMLYVGDALEEGGNDSVVIKTGVLAHPVFSPQETAKLIEALLR